jgi:shikimate kinase
MKNKILFLAGFMGSGKSTIGPILANTMGWNFYDLDKVIEEKIGMKVSEIFEKLGEKYFRKEEKDILHELIKKENIIVSLGGGTIVNEENLNSVKKAGKLIYLKASPSIVYERLRFKRDRPVLTQDGTINLGKNEFIDKVSKLMETRKKFYEQADFTIDTDNISIGLTVDKIVKMANY